MSVHTSPHRLLTTPDTLAALAGEHRSHATAITSLAGTETGGITGLGPTFGLIGTEFLAALAEVLGDRRRALHSLANAHGRVSAATTAAAGGYIGADADASAGLHAGDVP